MLVEFEKIFFFLFFFRMTAEYGDIQIDLPNVNYQKQPGRIQLSMTYVLWSGFSIFVFFKM